MMHKNRQNACSQFWCTAIILILGLVFSQAHASEIPDQQSDDLDTALDNVSSGTLLLQQSSGILDAPILESSVRVEVSGIVSKIELEQRFENTSQEWVEGVYAFPLPDQAAVNSLIIEIGERQIIGSIKEKKIAAKLYEKAKQNGQVAGLVKQHRANLFSTRFANIPPGESVIIKLAYIQTVNFDTDRFSLRIPLTLTPRYSNSLVTDANDITPPQIHSPSAASNTNVKHTVNITASLFGDYSSALVESPSHDLDRVLGDNRLDISLRNTALLDRDFILEWSTMSGQVPSISTWRETVGQDDYMLAMILPPQATDAIPDVARELILVIDTSGSMAGDPIEAAKASLLSALTGLGPNDRFNIIEFNSSFSTLFDFPREATPENLKRGERFAQRLFADGGTEMMPALQTALGYQQNDLLRQVVFITDGAVGYEESVMTTITRKLKAARLFTVGIGTAPNQWFMRKVAEAGRGSFHYVNNIAQAEPVMAALLHKLEAPALTDIDIKFTGGSADAVPNPVPDLYAGQPVIIAAKLDSATSGFDISGKWGTSTWDTQVDIASVPQVQTGISTVWAKRKIESLEDRQRFHSDPNHYKSLILQLALEHQLLSQYTSFLAVEVVPVRPANSPLASKAVPNLLPEGNQMQTINMPQGAAGSDTYMLLSLLFALLALLSAYTHVQRRDGDLP